MGRGELPFLLFTGDLVHGPSCTAEEWPSYLGTFFEDQSVELVERFADLQDRFPAKVSCLLGNHEHSHVGGPHTPKFWPDETQHFEQTAGLLKSRRFKKLFKTFPTVAVADCGLVVTHAAPNAVISGPDEIDEIRYRGMENLPISSLDQLPLLGRLLWSRTCPPAVSRDFLRALSSAPDSEKTMVVYGHEIVSIGYEKVDDGQLLLSTSFGVRDENKHYLQLDLARKYTGTRDLREGVELLRLYPDLERRASDRQSV